MNSQALIIKEEIEFFDEELDFYPSDIKLETIAFNCETMSNDVMFEAQPHLWEQAPIYILVESNGEENICILCGYVEGAPLTTDMSRKKSV